MSASFEERMGMATQPVLGNNDLFRLLEARYPREVHHVTMTSRVDATRDVQILNVMRHVNDPAAEGKTVGGMIIDTTRPRDSEEFEIAKPSLPALEKARAALDTDLVDSIPNRSALTW